VTDNATLDTIGVHSTMTEIPISGICAEASLFSYLIMATVILSD